jgi:hypothetical protein
MLKNGKLTARTRRWIEGLSEEFDLNEADKLLLQLAGEAFERGRECRKAIIRDGHFQRSSRGALVAHRR